MFSIHCRPPYIHQQPASNQRADLPDADRVHLNSFPSGRQHSLGAKGSASVLKNIQDCVSYCFSSCCISTYYSNPVNRHYKDSTCRDHPSTHPGVPGRPIRSSFSSPVAVRFANRFHFSHLAPSSLPLSKRLGIWRRSQSRSKETDSSQEPKLVVGQPTVATARKLQARERHRCRSCSASIVSLTSQNPYFSSLIWA
jgi:hypothetical protein